MGRKAKPTQGLTLLFVVVPLYPYPLVLTPLLPGQPPWDIRAPDAPAGSQDEAMLTVAADPSDGLQA